MASLKNKQTCVIISDSTTVLILHFESNFSVCHILGSNDKRTPASVVEVVRSTVEEKRYEIVVSE